jgi:hypothetical protein
MTTKKVFIVIGGIVAAAALLVAIFVGVIVGLAVYSIGKSEAAATARTFLKKNEKLKQDIGQVNDFGSFVTGNVNAQNAGGEATLYLKVIGERRTVNARVDLLYQSNRAWRVIDASYQNDKGQMIKLLDPYEPDAPEP